jgi:hypothetical protein
MMNYCPSHNEGTNQHKAVDCIRSHDAAPLSRRVRRVSDKEPKDPKCKLISRDPANACSHYKATVCGAGGRSEGVGPRRERTHGTDYPPHGHTITPISTARVRSCPLEFEAREGNTMPSAGSTPLRRAELGYPATYDSGVSVILSGTLFVTRCADRGQRWNPAKH